MKRREFLKWLGWSGIAAAAGPAVARVTGRKAADALAEPPPPSGQSAAGLTAPKLDTVRVAMIGVGARGSGHLAQLLQIQGVEITAISDLYSDWGQTAVKMCVDRGRKAPVLVTGGKDDYRKVLDRSDVDIAIISTPWEEHARMAVDAMERGKHAFIEVPACVTIDECWQLVETAEKTQRHCMMMENVCYGREELLALNLCRQGVLGELLHGEAAYIHDLRGQMHSVERGTGSWRTPHYIHRNGNLYPTHGLGPICQYMNINRGDRMDYLSSVSSNSRVRAEYAKKHFPPDHKWNREKFICGDINTTIIGTVNGKTILVQWDEQLPRPYTRLNLIQGTKGVWAGFPDRCAIEGVTKSTEGWTQSKDLAAIYEKYDHPLWKKVAALPENQGGHGGMDFIMLWRMIVCLRNGLPMDQDVYDAATWSCIAPLSEWSVAHRGQSVDVPDFTRGKWKTMKELPIIE